MFAVVVDDSARNWISSAVPAKPSALVDTRVIYCGDNLVASQIRLREIWRHANRDRKCSNRPTEAVWFSKETS